MMLGKEKTVPAAAPITTPQAASTYDILSTPGILKPLAVILAIWTLLIVYKPNLITIEGPAVVFVSPPHTAVSQVDEAAVVVFGGGGGSDNVDGPVAAAAANDSRRGETTAAAAPVTTE